MESHVGLNSSTSEEIQNGIEKLNINERNDEPNKIENKEKNIIFSYVIEIPSQNYKRTTVIKETKAATADGKLEKIITINESKISDTCNKNIIIANYFTLKDFNMREKDIKLINVYSESTTALTSAFKKINSSDIIGLDSEWVKTKHPIKSQIFQIATRTKAYIFDFKPAMNISINESKKISEPFQILLSETFMNENVKKVAWDFDLDLKNLDNRFKNSKLNTIKNFVDLMRVSPKHVEKGFSNHCHFYLNKQLDKTFQVSAWDHRPLSQDKLIYAALDSIAVIPLYEKMGETIDLKPGTLDLNAVDKRMSEYKQARAYAILDKYDINHNLD